MRRLNLVSLAGVLLVSSAACDGSKSAEPLQPDTSAPAEPSEPAQPTQASEPAEPGESGEPSDPAQQVAAMHPAAAHCVEQGGKSEVAKSAKGGAVDVCVFEDGSRCRAWALQRGECKPGDCRAADGKCEE